jgi:hypothetical protein
VRLNGSPTHSDLTSEFTSGWVSGDSSHPSHYSETRLGVTLANDSTAHRPTSTVESECLDSTRFVTSFSSHYFFRRSPHISFVIISAFLLVPLHWYDHLESLLTVPSREPNKVMGTVTASPISLLEFTPHLKFHSGDRSRPRCFQSQQTKPPSSTICLKAVLFRQSKPRNPSFGSILEREIIGER